MDLNNLEDVERFKRLFLDPIQEGVRDQLAPLVKQGQEHEDRIVKLESNQKKALMGYAAVVAILTIGWNYAKSKWLSRFFS